MRMKTKIERYTDKFIEANFDKRDRKENEFIKFEYFVNSLHCWEYSSESFNSRPKIGKEISLGKALGGDAFFLLIGNRIYSLQSNLEDVKEEISKNNNKIEFHLLQVKKSKKADLGDFKKFVEVPIKVIKEEGISKEQKELIRLQKFISELKENQELEPSFILTFYTEKDENEMAELRKSWTPEIKFVENQYDSYGPVKINLEGAKKLNMLYEQFNSNDYKLIISKDRCKFDNNYLIGFMTAKELLNSIAPEQENGDRILYPDIFRNNIRLYLGSTEVNRKIEETLISEPGNFHLYNNGLTITTKEIKDNALENYIITPVNIVNGCQTANSIYNVFKKNSKNIDIVKIPVKIIKASDEEYEKITIRTNTQNGISEKDLVSITTIQKDIEEFLMKQSFNSKHFFYKRQNAMNETIPSKIDYIVTINDILRAVFTTLVYLPHKVSGYFDKTTSDLIDVIFDDSFIKLYSIITVLYKFVEEFIESNYQKHKKLRYHIFYLLYKFANKDNDIDSIERYFIKEKRTSSDPLDSESLKKQTHLLEEVYSILYKLANDSMLLNKTLEYIIGVIEKQYPNLINLNDKESEKILYRTVDTTQKGERVFENFSKNFNKKIGEL